MAKFAQICQGFARVPSNDSRSAAYFRRDLVEQIAVPLSSFGEAAIDGQSDVSEDALYTAIETIQVKGDTIPIAIIIGFGSFLAKVYGPVDPLFEIDEGFA